MTSSDRLRSRLDAAMADGSRGLTVADRLCHACVELLPVDGAAISVVHGGATQGTFGSSGALSRRLDEYQFTFGEGPCLDAVRLGRPVLVPELEGVGGRRWPAFTHAAVGHGVRAIFALPVAIESTAVGALDLFRGLSGSLSEEGLTGGLLAAELATLPLLDLMTDDVDWRAAGEGGSGWAELESLERVEVYQATGMIMAQLDVGPAEALARLRARAYADGVTASEAAWAVVERRSSFVADDPGRTPGGNP
jgi:hypothetical protein